MIMNKSLQGLESYFNGKLFLVKSYKYIRRWLKNGKWVYQYPVETKVKDGSSRVKEKLRIAEKSKVIDWIKPLSDCSESGIRKQFTKLYNMSEQGNLKVKAYGNKPVVINRMSVKHFFKAKGFKRDLSIVNERAKFLPFVSEILNNTGVLSEKSKRSKNVVYGVVGRCRIGSEVCTLEISLAFDEKKEIFFLSDYEIKKSVGQVINEGYLTLSQQSSNALSFISILGINGKSIEDIKKSTFLLEKCCKCGKAAMRGLKTLGWGSTSQSTMTTFVACPVGACKTEALSTTSNKIQRPMYDGQDLFGKSFIFRVTDLTENNRFKKFEQLEKALTYMRERKPFIVNHVGLDGSKHLQDVTLQITDFSTEKIEKALRTMAMSLDVPLKSSKGEVFYYHSQEELTDKWVSFFTSFVKDCYEFITDYFDLPKKTQMTKSVLRYKGKILYQPETGTPIKQKDFDKFVKTLEEFLNRNREKSEQIVLSSQALAKILNRMLKTNKLKDVKNADLKGLSFKGKPIDWISESTKNFGKIFELNRNELARLETLKQSSTIHITNITDKMRNTVKQILIDGVSGRKSKSEISQELFDKMVGDCRDFQRLADTEVQNNFNNAFIKDEVNNAGKGEKIYFQRLEVVDGNTCDRCKKLNGKIALWCDKPQKTEIADDKIADYYIWEGKEWAGKNDKVCIGALHPFCRGTWVRYYEDTAKIDKLISGEK